jgi:hypothetical protein
LWGWNEQNEPKFYQIFLLQRWIPDIEGISWLQHFWISEHWFPRYECFIEIMRIPLLHIINTPPRPPDHIEEVKEHLMHIPTSSEYFILMRNALYRAARCFGRFIYIYLFGTSRPYYGRSVAYLYKVMARMRSIHTLLPSQYSLTTSLELCSQVLEECDVFGMLFVFIWLTRARHPMPTGRIHPFLEPQPRAHTWRSF